MATRPPSKEHLAGGGCFGGELGRGKAQICGLVLAGLAGIALTGLGRDKFADELFVGDLHGRLVVAGKVKVEDGLAISGNKGLL